MLNILNFNKKNKYFKYSKRNELPKEGGSGRHLGELFYLLNILKNQDIQNIFVSTKYFEYGLIHKNRKKNKKQKTKNTIFEKEKT